MTALRERGTRPIRGEQTLLDIKSGNTVLVRHGWSVHSITRAMEVWI